MASPAPQAYGIHRQDIQAAMAKAEELRALHAALMNGGAASSPAAARMLPAGPSPFLARAPHPFPPRTTLYEDHLPGYHHYACSESQAPSETLSRAGLDGGRHDVNGELFYNKEVNSSRIMNREDLFFQAMDGQPFPGSSALRKKSPGTETIGSSRRIASEEFKAVSTSRKCRPASIDRERNTASRNQRKMIPPVQEIDAQRNRGAMLSRLFPRFRRKPKSEMSPNTLETEEMSQLFKDWGICSLETLKRELIEANENRDVALAEVSEMRSSLDELRQKLVHLETYCEELKKALRQAAQGKDAISAEKLSFPRRANPSGGDGGDGTMPVSHDVMVEGFLQIASEARLSVRQLCKILITQIDEADTDLAENLELLLRPHHLNLNSRHSKGLLFHFEGVVNRVFYEDFENCGFERNGSPRALDPQQDRMESFSAFVALRNLSSSKALRKGTKSYCEAFNRFCDQKMSSIILTLGWSRPWPDHLAQSFFVAAKCIWLLHLLAFSFSPPLPILRVSEHRSFDPVYMEDALADRLQAHSPSRVKIMVAPGFYVEDRVLRCKVLCRHKLPS
ncbi:unnamed protein product [Spirodela intermedia]|uniref:Uncharacterized protein n=1 Tax=Spirodela intermedia TaxID=51605 RepID=A0A7I8IUU1_SPIIN|nr:unnamed protein product [Spirodela intermedia]CAA6661588.1 unnamed protein product [Spirodela intermedia]